MKREARDFREGMPRPVQRIPLEENASRSRLIWTLIALTVAAGAFFFGFRGILNGEAGWTVIESEGIYGASMTLRYRLGETKDSPSAEQKKVRQIYALALEENGKAFDIRNASEEPRNLAWLNRHPNTETEIAPILFQALQASLASGRWVYLGPLYEMNESLLASRTDAEAEQSDPRRNPEMAKFLEEILPMLQTDEHIRIAFSDGNRVCLHISEALRTMGESYGVERWIDFGWQRGAYLTDAVAAALSAAGAEHGVLTYQHGFVRCLEKGASFRMDIHGAEGSGQVRTESLTYTGPISILSLSAFPSPDLPAGYRYGDGTLRTPWISAADGLDHAPVDTMVAAARESGCAELLTQVLPVLTREPWEDSLPSLKDTTAMLVWKNGIRTVTRNADGMLEDAGSNVP